MTNDTIIITYSQYTENKLGKHTENKLGKLTINLPSLIYYLVNSTYLTIASVWCTYYNVSAYSRLIKIRILYAYLLPDYIIFC